MNEDISDEQLMLMFRHGVAGAFDLLFEKHRRGALGFALRMLGDRAAAEDVCQDVFLRVVTSAGTYEPVAKFKTWLFVILRNCCRDRIRRLKPEAMGALETAPAERGGPGEEAEEKDGREWLEREIGRLPEELREAFLLRFRHEMAYEEIASVTGQPVGTAKTRVHRARTRLAEAMREAMGDTR